MKEKIVKSIIYLSGFICLLAFIGVRSEKVFNFLLHEDIVPNYWDKTKYGELYYFSYISHFKEVGLPPSNRKFEYSSKHASADSADILTFGDSFFEISREKQFSERIADDFNKAVFFKSTDFPLAYLSSNGYSSKEPKLLILERVERYIPVTFEKEHHPEPLVKVNTNRLFSALKGFKDKIFVLRSEQLYDAMLKRSYLTTAIYSWIATAKFDLFGYISKMTPKYKVNENNSWLFYHDQVTDAKTSFYYQHSDEEMQNICRNMKALADDMDSLYNIKVLYLPLPAKYTVHHDIINNDVYNNFLPELYNCLDQYKVKYVNLFDNYMAQDTILYYRTDSHWNEKGIKIAYNKTIHYIQQDSTLSKFLKQ